MGAEPDGGNEIGIELGEIRLCPTCEWRYLDIHSRVKGKVYWRKECAHCRRVRNGRVINGRPIQYGKALLSPRRRLINTDQMGTLTIITCSKCGWYGYCDIDHINGDPNDNGGSNLQVLCPNCHRDKHLGKPSAPSIKGGEL